jgi:hypothetical protein
MALARVGATAESRRHPTGSPCFIPFLLVRSPFLLSALPRKSHSSPNEGLDNLWILEYKQGELINHAQLLNPISLLDSSLLLQTSIPSP